MVLEKKECKRCVPWLYVKNLSLKWVPSDRVGRGVFDVTFTWGIEKITCGVDRGSLLRERAALPWGLDESDLKAIADGINANCEVTPYVGALQYRTLQVLVNQVLEGGVGWGILPAGVLPDAPPMSPDNWPAACDEVAGFGSNDFWTGFMTVMGASISDYMGYPVHPPVSTSPIMGDPMLVSQTGGDIIFSFGAPIYSFALEEDVKQPKVCCKELPSSFTQGPPPHPGYHRGSGGKPPTCCGLMQDAICHCLQQKAFDTDTTGLVRHPNVPPMPGHHAKYCASRDTVKTTWDPRTPLGIGPFFSPSDPLPLQIQIIKTWLRFNKPALIEIMKSWLNTEFTRVISQDCTGLTTPNVLGAPVWNPSIDPPVPAIGFDWSSTCKCTRTVVWPEFHPQGRERFACPKPPW